MLFVRHYLIDLAHAGGLRWKLGTFKRIKEIEEFFSHFKYIQTSLQNKNGTAFISEIYVTPNSNCKV